MRQLFATAAGDLGDGRIVFAWSPRGNYLAAAGSKRAILVFDRHGKLVEEIRLPPPEAAASGASDARAPCCVQLEWDAAGDALAALPTGSSAVYVWFATTRELQRLETEFRAQEVSMVCWARGLATLAAGTAKGNLQLFQLHKRRRVPVMGKHTKRVLCSAWNDRGQLVMGAADKMVTLTDGETGDTLRSWQLRAEPREVAAAAPKHDDPGAAGEAPSSFSVIAGKQTLCLLRHAGASGLGSGGAAAPLEQSFQERYGEVRRHVWLGPGLVMLAFRTGQVVVVSSASDEVGTEVHSARPLELLSDMAFCPALGRVAVGGGTTVKVLEVGSRVQELPSEALEAPSGQLVDALGWSPDGQVLTVATSSGQLFSYLAALPAICAAAAGRLAHLTSLSEITVVDAAGAAAAAGGPGPAAAPASRVALACEPAFCAVGPYHLAVGINNQVFYYAHGHPQFPPGLLATREYLSAVSGLALTSTHAAVLTDGRVLIHPLGPPEAGQAPDDRDATLPAAAAAGTAAGAPVACVGVTEQFVVTGTAAGAVCYHLLPGLEPVAEYRHAAAGIRHLWPQPDGVRCVFEDERGATLLLNALDSTAAPLPGLEARPTAVIWDCLDTRVFVVSDGTSLLAYIATPALTAAGGDGSQSSELVEGSAVVRLLGRTPLPATHTPLVVANGAVTCRLKGGALDTVVLESHSALQGLPLQGGPPGGAPATAIGAGAKSALSRRFAQALKLQRLEEAWRCAVALRTADTWRQLGVAALEALDFELAIAVHQQLGDASTVLSLEALSGTEDRPLLAGHALVLLGRDPDAAQDCFLCSGRPLAALEMRMDLKQWPQALALARRLAPGEVPRIGQRHAAALEMTGDAAAARQHYQQALDAVQSAAVASGNGHGSGTGGYSDDNAEARDQTELRTACLGGLARTALRLGDIQAGRAAALQVNDPELYKACAAILEEAGHLPEAAEMYERAGLVERAAQIHIAAKNFAAAQPLMARVASSKLQVAYARAKEAQGRWQEAAAAYEAGGDVAAAVRLMLEKLDAPGRAAALVRKAGPGAAPEAAAAVARHCLAARDARSAVELLLLAGQMDQAFDVASSQGQMEAFVAAVNAGATADSEVEKVAAYYEKRGQLEAAADMWGRAGQAERAVKLYLQVGGAAAVGKAIALVEASGGDATLAASVLTFIDGPGSEVVGGDAAASRQRATGGGVGGGGVGGAGALDDASREELRFRLHLALGRLPDAARSAVQLARLEQDAGDYRGAHSRLFRAARQLGALGGRPPVELVSALALLHSYVLVRSTGDTLKDRAGAARLLARVAQSISRFPRHAAQILTSGVICAQRAQHKTTAFELAATLMRPEYRSLIPEKYRKTVELAVRKPDLAPDPDPPLSPCPYCRLPGPADELQCVSCRGITPFDIATGMRMRLDDWCECPSCRFPCSSAPMRALLAAEGACPLCGERAPPEGILPLPEPEARLSAALMGAEGTVPVGADAGKAAAVGGAGAAAAAGGEGWLGRQGLLDSLGRQ